MSAVALALAPPPPSGRPLSGQLGGDPSPAPAEESYWWVYAGGAGLLALAVYKLAVGEARVQRGIVKRAQDRLREAEAQLAEAERSGNEYQIGMMQERVRLRRDTLKHAIDPSLSRRP